MEKEIEEGFTEKEEETELEPQEYVLSFIKDQFGYIIEIMSNPAQANIAKMMATPPAMKFIKETVEKPTQ